MEVLAPLALVSTDVTDDLKVNGASSPMSDTFKQLNAPKPVFRLDKGHILNVI